LALLLLFASLWAVGVLTEDVVTGDPIVRLDRQVADWLHDHRSAELTSLLRAVTTLGSAWVLVPLTVSLAVYGALAYLASRRLGNAAAGRAVLIGAVLLVVLIGFSRLYLGVHFLSDVLAGLSAGLAWLVLCVLAVDLRRPPNEGITRGPSRRYRRRPDGPGEFGRPTTRRSL